MLPKPRVFATPQELGNAVATAVLEEYHQKGRLVLGVPWGATPVPVFDAFAGMVARNRIDLSRIHIVMMDDYVMPDNSSWAYSPRAPYSGHYLIRADLLEKLPKQQAQQLQPQIYFPDPNNPNDFDTFIKKQLRGVDVFLVATGAEDGHVGMCPPGTNLESRTRIVQLPEAMRAYNFRRLLEHFSNDKSKVPHYAATVGLATITDANRLIFMAHGREKRDIVEILCRTTSFDEDYPVTFLHNVPHKVMIYLDQEAAKYIHDLVKRQA